MKKIIISIVIVLAIAVFVGLIFDWGRREAIAPEVNSNASTTENLEQYSSSTLEMPIIVNNIIDNQEVSSPIKIEGKARGNWFFEATFPIQLVDADGNTIASTLAQAKSDWMTTDFVNFTAELKYDKPTSTTRALIVLSKDNPSGNPDFDQSIFIPVKLK
jgi:hypothetical protein